MSAQNKAESMPSGWQQYDTLLLDMDGTLLDLAFDNYFWRELIPRMVARRRNITDGEAQDSVFEQYAGKEGTLDWYCLDFWGEQLGLDLVALKAASSQRIRFLPGAREFLRVARTAGKRLVLVTNAHQDNLQMKIDITGLRLYVDEFLCSHDLGAPKEHQAFWQQAQQQLGFAPAGTLFVDDSEAVLDAAKQFGIGGVVAVRCPDTRAAPKQTSSHQAIGGVSDWV